MDSAWLKNTLRSKRITQRVLGEAIGLTQDKINKVLAHVRQFTTIEAIKVAVFLENAGIPRNETLGALLGKEALLIMGKNGFAENPPTGFAAAESGAKPIPIVGTVGVGGLISLFGPDVPEQFADPVPTTGADSPVAVRIIGTALYPVYREGDLLYFIDHGLIDGMALNKDCVVQMEDGRIFVKTVKRGSLPGTYSLDTFSAPPMENVRLSWISRILWAKKQ